MLSFYHRDKIQKIIRLNDQVVWSNGKQNQSMQICRVRGTTSEKVIIEKPNGRAVRVYPQNLIVITEQILHNIHNHVGAGLEPRTQNPTE